MQHRSAAAALSAPAEPSQSSCFLHGNFATCSTATKRCGSEVRSAICRRRRRMVSAIVSPAAARAAAPTDTRAGFMDCEAPPKPVCGAPVGMTDATVPDAPATPVDPPAPTAPPLPPPSAERSTGTSGPTGASCSTGPTGPTGPGRGRCRCGCRGGEDISERGRARHRAATTDRGVVALSDRHGICRRRARHGAAGGRLSGIRAPAVDRHVALRHGGIGRTRGGGTC